MLTGLRANERIIVGAYVDDEGGVCPMLAAHRCGGRTDFLAFAKSWDRFTRAAGRARRATERELGILVRLLEDSLERDGTITDLAGAIAEHRELRERSRPSRGQHLAKEADPVGEIAVRRAPAPESTHGPKACRGNFGLCCGRDYSASPGRTNIISGTMQAGEILVR